MNTALAASGPMFLPGLPGQRFCLYHAPAGVCRGAILYVAPFGDEMNKSRRMAALHARALAQRGYGVLQLDLYGCGDSDGEFADARLDLWLADLALGVAWLRRQLNQPLSLWGLRLGALLALAFAHGLPQPPRAILLWQPQLSGSHWLTQLLRLKMAAGMLTDAAAHTATETAANARNNSTAALRTRLQAGETLEIAGYVLAPALALAIAKLDADRLAVTGCPVHWIDVASGADGQLPPAARLVAQHWRAAGVDLDVSVVDGPAFWATQEISENAAVLAASSAIFERANAAAIDGTGR